MIVFTYQIGKFVLRHLPLLILAIVFLDGSQFFNKILLSHDFFIRLIFLAEFRLYQQIDYRNFFILLSESE